MATYEDLLKQLQILSALGPLDFAHRLEMDTSVDVGGAVWTEIVNQLSS